MNATQRALALVCTVAENAADDIEDAETREQIVNAIALIDALLAELATPDL